MRLILTLLFSSCIVLAGCQGKQARLAQLNAQYKTLHQQYFNDCIAPMQGGTDAYFKGEKPKVVSPKEEAAHDQKCAQELEQVTTLGQQMAALSK
jgi:hypothetical protein